MSKDDPVSVPPVPNDEECMDPVNIAHVCLREMLEAIRNNDSPSDTSPETVSDRALNQLHYRDFPALQRAAAHLEVKSKNRKHNVVLCSHLLAMLGTLDLYLDSSVSYTW